MIFDQLSHGTPFHVPFPYFVAPQAFTPEASMAMLAWLEHAAPWKLVETSFYEQYEFSFLDGAVLPRAIDNLVSLAARNEIKSKMEEIFHVKFSQRLDLTAHKLISGQRIRIHNDYIPNQETHRLLIQLNRNWVDENGGLLMFFNSANPTDIHKAFRPAHNSSVAFAISPDSHHAVSTIHSGERYTIVYSFYSTSN